MNIATLYVTGVIGEDTTLLDVIKQVKAQSDAESFIVKIDSVGGYVDAGNDIYNYLKNLPQSITTYTSKAYSIASVIFMAGDTRIIPADASDALMIHLPWMQASGDYSTLNEYLSELKSTEDSLVKFYSEAIEVDKETIHSLLKSETYLSGQQALDLGFATELSLQQKAVAMLAINRNNKEIKEESLMNKLNKKIDRLMNMISGKSTIKNLKVVQDGTGVEMSFPDLDATDEIEIGDKVQVDGKEADGEFVLPDGSSIIIEKGIVTEIKTVDTTEETPIEQTEEPQAKNEIVKQISKWEMDLINSSFEVGEALKYTYEDVEYSVGAGEYELTDGSTIVTDADGIVIEKKSKEPAESPQAKAVEGDDASDEDKDAIIADLQEQVKDLKEKLADYEVEDVPTEEEVATEEVNKMLEVIEAMAMKQKEMENKYLVLAKSIGSDFSSDNKKEIKTSIKGSVEHLSRAAQILNS